MMCDRFHSLSMLGRMLQDLKAGHDATLHFIEDDVATKFDQRAAFMAGNAVIRHDYNRP